ncbi:MAG: hypothetical protein KKF00_04150 [Proteobacteria bacterium]|nr:hypothetical protein [Pseudomonadota bacterium]
MKHSCRQVGIKKHENVIPAEVGIQKALYGFPLKDCGNDGSGGIFR